MRRLAWGALAFALAGAPLSCSGEGDTLPPRPAYHAPDKPAATMSDGAPSGESGGGWRIEKKFGVDLVRYGTVQRPSETRVMYVEASAIASLPQTGPMPDGVRILLEASTLPESGFLIEKKGGVWVYATFEISQGVSGAAPVDRDTCLNCHAGAPEPAIFTVRALRRFLGSKRVEALSCSTGAMPCEAALYE